MRLMIGSSLDWIIFCEEAYPSGMTGNKRLLADVDIIVTDRLAPAGDLALHHRPGRRNRTPVLGESRHAFVVPVLDDRRIGYRRLQRFIERVDDRSRRAGWREQCLPVDD